MYSHTIEITPVVIGDDPTFLDAANAACAKLAGAAFPPPLDPTDVFLRPPSVAIIEGRDPEGTLAELRRLECVFKRPLAVVVCHFDPEDLVPDTDRVCAIPFKQGGPGETLENSLFEVVRWLAAGYAVQPRRAPTAAAPPVRVEEDEIMRLRMLSPTECRVLMLLAEAKSNKLIARTLRISDNTVRVHMRSIFIKLGVENRTQAALLATRFRHCDVWQNKVVDLLSAG